MCNSKIVFENECCSWDLLNCTWQILFSKEFIDRIRYIDYVCIMVQTRTMQIIIFSVNFSLILIFYSNLWLGIPNKLLLHIFMLKDCILFEINIISIYENGSYSHKHTFSHSEIHSAKRITGLWIVKSLYFYLMIAQRLSNHFTYSWQHVWKR